MTQFTEEEDRMFLRELSAAPPFEVSYGMRGERWKLIATRVSQAVGHTVTPRSLRDRLATLEKNFKRAEEVSRRASGIAEEYSERDDLLEQYINLKETNRRIGTVEAPEESSSLQNVVIAASSPNDALMTTDETESLYAVDTRVSRVRRNPKQSVLMEAVANQLSVSRQASEERLEIAREEAKRHVERVRQEDRRLELEERRLLFEMSKYEHQEQERRQLGKQNKHLAELLKHLIHHQRQSKENHFEK
jgi:hypothetical protein